MMHECCHYCCSANCPIFEDDNIEIVMMTRRHNKRERYDKHRNKLKRLYKARHGYFVPVVYADEVWLKNAGYVKNPKPYYKRLYREKRSSYVKNQSNRKIRRYKGELHNGYHHIHKLYDFEWEMS